MRKEWISALNFETKRTEQKMETQYLKKIDIIKFNMRNVTHKHYYNLFNKLYTKDNFLHCRNVVQYLW